MDGLNILFAPTTVFFLIATLGYMLGKIKVFDFSLDLSAVLIAAVAFGYILSRFFPVALNVEFNSAMGIFSKTGTALFVSAIGISTGASIFKNKNFLVYFFVGVVIAISGFISAKIIGIIDSNIDMSLLMGIFCGAMTSTPGLAVLCESQILSQDLVTLGYGIAYVFGVVAVVFFVQQCPDSKEVSQQSSSNNAKTIVDVFVIICVVSVLGKLVNLVNLPVVNTSFGITGSTLFAGVFVSLLLKKLTPKSIDLASLSIYRNLGLIMFFIGNGVTAGVCLDVNIQGKWVLYGAIITIISILFGNIICRILKGRGINCSVSISGGMTSTPAINAILKKTSGNIDISGYSFAYFGALLTIILCLKFLIV